MNTETITIPAANLDNLNRKLSKLHKRAAKLGIAAPTLEVGEPYEVPGPADEYGRPTMLNRVDVTVSMQPVKLEGWTFIGTIEHTDEGNIVRAVPGFAADLTHFRTTGRTCDHCNLNRQRNDTYLVLGTEDGRSVIRQVGSSCLADFVGGYSRDPVAVVEMLRTLWELVADFGSDDDESYGGGGGELAIETPAFLAMVSATIRTHGWLPKGKAWDEGRVEMATAAVTWDRLTDRKYKEQPYLEAIQRTDHDVLVAREAAAWAADISPDEENDYLYNLGVACRLSLVTWRRAGIVASAITAYQRKLAKEQAAEVAAASEWVGEIKQRITAQVTVTDTRWIETAYGGSMLVKMRDSEDNVLTWFASNPPDAIEIGAGLTITGTVKDHKEFRGAKETALTRCKVKV